MGDIRAGGARLAYPLFQTGDGGSRPTSALHLHFRTADFKTARALNRLWHSRLPRTGPGCRIAYAAECGDLIYAVAIWGRPLARLLPQFDWLELYRLAVAPDAPRNTASRMLGWMARDIRTRFPGVTRLVSYQDTEVHTGGIYRAAGWLIGADGEGGEWTRPSRAANRAQSAAPKRRWEKSL